MAARRWTIRLYVSIAALLLVSIILFPSAARSLESAGKVTVELRSGWEFRRVGGDGWHPASVPGCVHTDLLAAGSIVDPFYGTNEDSLQWIELDDWEYRTTFTAVEEVLARQRIDLVFEGLDTYASVYLNDSLVLEGDNMFREWRVDCAAMIREGKNELRVLFRSPVRKVENEWRSLGRELPGGPRVLTRKAAYHYGWDWAPRFVTCGVWRPVRLEAWDGSRIVSMRIIQHEISSAGARLTAELEIESAVEHYAEIDLYVCGPRNEAPRELAAAGRLLSAGKETVGIDFEIVEPLLWWPNGMGEQHLYTIIAQLEGAELLDETEAVIGLHTVELITERDGAGESFFFEVNGVPLFMKGANWVPMDSFVPRVGEDRYRSILQAAAGAHMNMLRVWGGGVYEDDRFYDLCDELGILVWQDFMFACAMYPGDDEFMQNVESEAVGAVERLRNHPCIALWCGNNEGSEGWHNWGWQRRYGYSADDSARIWRDYEKLFHRLLPRIVSEHDGTRPYHPSSPRYGRADPRSLTEGDNHYWGVWHDAEPFGVFDERVGRFMSEYGFQSFPDMRTIEAFAPPAQRLLGSEAMSAHQKHPRGNELIRTYMERDYPVPDDFESFVYISQLLQADGVRRAVEAHRRAMPRCMGTLYWQLNDCWPAASWSSVDYHGRSKALLHSVHDAFAPLLVSIAKGPGDTLGVYIVSDRAEPVPLELELRAVDFSGAVLHEERIEVLVGERRCGMYHRVDASSFLKAADPAEVLFVADITGSHQDHSRALYCFVPPKALRLQNPHIRVSVVGGEEDGCELLVESESFAKGVFLSIEGGEAVFSRNYFDMLAGESVRVKVRGSARLIDEPIVVRSLFDVMPYREDE
jgi:beta-mannosidase